MYSCTFHICYNFVCLYLNVHLRIDKPIRMTTSISVHTVIFCKNLLVHVRAMIVYWLELAYNCGLFDSVPLFYLFVVAVVDTVFFVCVCVRDVLLSLY